MDLGGDLVGKIKLKVVKVKVTNINTNRAIKINLVAINNLQVRVKVGGRILCLTLIQLTVVHKA